MPADCSRNTNGPALPSMIGTSPAVQVDVQVVDAQARERRHQVLDGGHAGARPRERRAERVSVTFVARAGISTGGSRSVRRNTMPVSGGAGRSAMRTLRAGVQADAGGADRSFRVRCWTMAVTVPRSYIARGSPAAGQRRQADSRCPVVTSDSRKGRVPAGARRGGPTRAAAPAGAAARAGIRHARRAAGHAPPQSAWRRRKAGMSSTSSEP